MRLSEIIRALVRAGATPEMILAAVEAAESNEATALERRRASDAERQQRKRERDGHVMSRDVTVTVNGPFPSSLSPEPPIPLTNPNSPLPPKSADLAEQIWQLQPAREGKRRATRPDVRRALTTALKAAEPGEILAACQAYYRHSDHRKEGGEFAMGAARLLMADRWRDYVPSKPLEPTSDHAAWRAEQFKATGEWQPAWGPKPKEIAA